MIGLGSKSVTSLNKWVLLILCKDTPPNSYLRTGVPLIYAFALFPLVIPVIDPPEAPVYLITSSPIFK